MSNYDNKLYKCFDAEFLNRFVFVGCVLLKNNKEFWEVKAFLDDRFIYIDNGNYLMMFPADSIKKILWKS